MGGRRRAFALVTSLVTASAVFGATLALAVLTRAAMVESGALSRALTNELQARTAAARVVSGVIGESAVPSSSDDPAASGTPDGPAVDTDELPEMPEFLREFLETYLDEPVEEEENADGGSSSSSRSQSGERAARQLKARGLPTAPVAVIVDGRTYLVMLTDALGGLNINTAEIDELEALFALAGADPVQSESIAAELVDYRDADNFVTPRGAEAAAYLRRGLVIPNEPMRSIEELLYLPSMTPAVFRRVRPLVTAHGDGMIHAPTAPLEAMAAVSGVGIGGAESIASLRSAGTLDAETLRKSLSLFADDAVARFRFVASPVIRVRVAPEGAGPVFTSVAAITDDGIRWTPFIQE